MEAHKREFIELIVQSGVLRFGHFVAKSGRHTPYFIDTGRYRTGTQIARLGRCYARAIHARLGDRFDVLFGPAYKGIPLAITTAIALGEQYGRDVGYSFNRKEVKDHGEGGVLLGHPLRDGDRVLIIEDVITAGTAVRESIELLRATAAIELVGVVVGVDRMERGQGERSALAELRAAHGLDAFAIVTIDEVIEALRGGVPGGEALLDEAAYARLASYRARYGTRE
jgi:orotate phosphoribosyltransferase